MICTAFSLTLRRAVLNDVAMGWGFCLGTPMRVAPISSLSRSTAALDDLGHCSQAEANEAAAAQIAAHSPSEDSRAAINNASLVRLKATSHRFRSVRNGPCGSRRSLTE